MQFVSSTPFAALLFLFSLYFGPIRALSILFLSFPFGAAAAFSVAGFGNVLVTDVCVLALWISMIGRVRLDVLLSELFTDRSATALLFVAILAAISAVFYPRIFLGWTDVFAVVKGYETAVIETISLEPRGANIGQFVRLLIGISAFIAVLAIAQDAPGWRWAWQALVSATIAHTTVSLVDWIGHPLGLSNLLAPVRSVVQAVLMDQSFPGLRRIIGGYTEPASFGLFTMGLLGVWMRLAISDLRFRGAGLAVAILTVLAVRSTSTATIANLLVVAMGFVVWNHRAIFLVRGRLVTLLVICAALPMFYASLSIYFGYSPMGSALVEAMIWDKATSSSGEERALWNAQAYRNFVETFGVGAGIGSARASGWVFAVLASFGVPGLVLFLWFLWNVFVSSSDRGPVTRATEVASACRWGCLALLLQSCLTRPYPDLGVFFFALAGIAVALGARSTKRRRRAALSGLA